jgi:hypothetical protein
MEFSYDFAMISHLCQKLSSFLWALLTQNFSVNRGTRELRVKHHEIVLTGFIEALLGIKISLRFMIHLVPHFRACLGPPVLAKASSSRSTHDAQADWPAAKRGGSEKRSQRELFFS